MVKQEKINNGFFADLVLRLSLPITRITPVNPIPISKLSFSPKKGWEYAVQHGYSKYRSPPY
jgi:hypothetical protein